MSQPGDLPASRAARDARRVPEREEGHLSHTYEGHIGSSATFSLHPQTSLTAVLTLQAQVRGWLQRRYAHRLLLCLHVIQLVEDDGWTGTGHPAEAPPAGPSVATCHNVLQGRATLIYEAVSEYASALYQENLTRRLLLEELWATSTVAQGTLPSTRATLKRRHPALRPLLLNTDMAKQAIDDAAYRCSSTSSPEMLQEVMLPKIAAFVGPYWTKLWPTSAALVTSASSSRPSMAALPIDVAEGTGPNTLPPPLPPRPLQQRSQLPSDYAAVEEGSAEEQQDAAEVDALHVALAGGGEAVEDEEERANAAYRKKREAADEEAMTAARKATMEGCPLSFPSPSAANHRSASSDVEGRAGQPDDGDVDLVIQPILGGAGHRRRRLTGHAPSHVSPTSTTAPADPAGSFTAGPSGAPNGAAMLMCVVCELDGVLPDTSDVRTLEAEDGEDVLRPCRTCHALVHTCCTLRGPAGECFPHPYCCSDCRTRGGA